MDLDQLDLNPRITAAVKKGRLKSVKEVLCYSGPDLQRLTSLPTHDVQHLLRAAALHLQGSRVLTALQLFQQRERFPEQHQRLSLGCPVLDQFLGGGLPLEGIIDLAGRSSAGKTQLALQLCLTVQFPRQYGGLEAVLELSPWIPRVPVSSVYGEDFSAEALASLLRAYCPKAQGSLLVAQLFSAAGSGWPLDRYVPGAVYICTEDVFPSKRLWQLIEQQQQLRTDVPGEVVQKIKFGNHIFIEHAADVDTLLECVSKRVPILLSRGMARLVVVDSVAAPFRCEYDVQALATRAKHLRSLGTMLRRLSSTFRSPVLCINQVTEMVEEQESMLRPLGAWDEHLSPALGVTWADQLLMRLMVDRVREDDATVGLPRSPARTLRVLFAPHLPLSSCCYTVAGEGIRGIPGTESC